MGNTVSGSKDRHIDDSVDFGSLSPQGVYTGLQDWNQQVVGHLIVDRKLAPFYRPLEDYEESWDDERILAARKENPNAQPTPLPEPPLSASSTSSKFHHHRHPNKAGKEPFRPTEASVYRGAIECPICFLYYPPNINRSRCCDQAICTECFVQIKRAEPTTTHLVSEPASCPYCVQENFGVTYDPPPWRTGLVKDGQAPPTPTRPDTHKNNSGSFAESENTKRRKSFGADSPEVVTIDQIRPDWEAKLAAVRAAVTRRANRRIIMRQVGDRLIPIGVTSGRVLGEPADGASGNAEGAEGGTGRRRRRAHGGQDINQILGSVGLGGLGGHDLEELMVMEAMRLSLVEHEEQQRRQNNNGTNNDSNTNDPSSAAPGASGTTNGNNASPASSTTPSPRTSLSPPTSTPIPAPRTPSPGPTPSPRQSPPRSRFTITPSPLSTPNDGHAPPGSAPPGVYSHTPQQLAGGTLQPPAPRAHRRTGSSPGSPSGSTLAAALSAAQTASAFLNSAEERPVRSAPQTRVASPSPSPSPAVLGTAAHAPAVNVEAGAEPAESSSAPAESSSAPAVAASPSPLAETQTQTETPASEDGSSRDLAGYQPLPSSTGEPSDPLLGWEK